MKTKFVLVRVNHNGTEWVFGQTRRRNGAENVRFAQFLQEQERLARGFTDVQARGEFGDEKWTLTAFDNETGLLAQELKFEVREAS